MQNKFLLILALFFSLYSFANSESINYSKIDLDKFSGFWFEMVRTPNFSQKKCNYSSLHYKNLSESEAEITNFCITFDGGKKKARFHASLINKNNTNKTFF